MNTITYIPTLTPLRGIAAVLVVLFHFNIFLGPLHPKENIFLVDKWYLMVDLFFVLSGFIMYHVYGDSFRKSISSKDFWSYFKARFARLYPLHFVMLFILVVVSIFFYNQVDAENLPPVISTILNPKAIPTSVILVQAWGFHLEAPWNTASWSISVEWFLYILFPFMMFYMAHYARSAKWVLGTLSVLAMVILIYYIHPGYQQALEVSRGIPNAGENPPVYNIDFITGWALLRGWCGFVFGMIAYELYQQQNGSNFWSNGYLFLGIWAFLLIMWIGDWLPDFLSIICFSILILNTALVKGKIQKILNSRVFTFLGDISYSIYMVHMPLILILFLVGMMMAGGAPEPPVENPENSPEIQYGMNWIGAFVFTLIVIGIANLTYRFIEKPGRNYLKNKLKVKKTTSTAPESET